MRRSSLLSLFLLVLLLGVLVHERYPQRLVQRLRPPQPVAAPTYDRNPAFLEQAPLQAAYGTHGARIVMLGTSYTYRADWNELLNRCDVINRGISSDVTAGLYERLLPLLKDTAIRICFLEGGGNDLPRGVPPGRVVSTLHRMADSLKAHRIVPVLTTTPYCSADQPRWQEANLRISLLNATLRSEAPRWSVRLLDLSALLSGTAEILPRRYAVAIDGVHLTAPAYLVWRDAVLRVLYSVGL